MGAAARAEGLQAGETARSVIFYGCRSTTFYLGLREKYWREHVRDMLRRHRRAIRRRACCSIRLRRGSSSTAAASTPSRS